jgi:hypothetical protein
MALKRVWHSVVDIPLDDTSSGPAIHKSTFLAAKRCLVGDFTKGGTVGANGLPPKPWVLDYSSNGVAAGAGDRLASIADAVRGTTQVQARSWFTALSQSGGKRVTVDWRGNADYRCALYASRDPVNNVGGLTTIIAPGMSSFVANVTNGGPNAAGYSDLLGQNTATGMHRAAFTMSSDGEYWMFLSYKPSVFPAGVVTACFGVWPIVPRAGVSGMVDPWCLFIAPSDGSGFAARDLVSAWLTPSNAAVSMYLPSGHAATTARAIVAANTTGSSNILAGLDAINPFTGSYDEIEMPVSPSETATVRGPLGVLEDLGLVHINMQGTWTPHGGIERVAWSNLLIPFAAAPVL